MALVENSIPPSVIFASECMKYDLSLNDIPSPATEYRILLAQLFDSGDNTVMQQKQYEPSDVNDNWTFNLVDIAKANLGVDIPKLNQGNVTVANTLFSKSFYLKRGERVITKATGAIVDSLADTAATTVLNAYIQDYQNYPVAANMVLTDKRVVQIYNDSHDWIRIYGTYLPNIIFHYTDGTITQVAYGSISNCLMPTGPAQILPLNPTPEKNVKRYYVDFPGAFYVLYLPMSPCETEDKRIDIFFLEPKGSWSVMNFDVVESEVVNRDMVNICRVGECTNDIETLFNNYGREIINIRSWISFSVKKTHLTDEENIEYYRAFANARQYRAVYRFADGTKKDILCPLILKDNEIPINKGMAFNEMELGFFYGHDLKSGF